MTLRAGTVLQKFMRQGSVPPTIHSRAERLTMAAQSASELAAWRGDGPKEAADDHDSSYDYASDGLARVGENTTNLGKRCEVLRSGS
jgi:hypothetical protein